MHIPAPCGGGAEASPLPALSFTHVENTLRDSMQFAEAL